MPVVGPMVQVHAPAAFECAYSRMIHGRRINNNLTICSPEVAALLFRCLLLRDTYTFRYKIASSMHPYRIAWLGYIYCMLYCLQRSLYTSGITITTICRYMNLRRESCWHKKGTYTKTRKEKFTNIFLHIHYIFTL